jgi:hypothetical protein
MRISAESRSQLFDVLTNSANSITKFSVYRLLASDRSKRRAAELLTPANTRRKAKVCRKWLRSHDLARKSDAENKRR